MLTATLLVGLGGAIGSIARFWTTILAARLIGEAFPWGTVALNVLGSFLIGAFAAATAAHATNLRAFLMAGICGGYTTFSAFSLQTLVLLRTQGWMPAAANAALSVVLCVLATALGVAAATRTS